MASIIPSSLLAVHQWGDLWHALFLAFYLQYISGEICGVYYCQLFTCSTSVGRSVVCIIPSLFFCSTLVGRSVRCIIPSFLLAVHQWGDLWGVLFLAFYLQYISVEICEVHYS